MKYSEAIQFLYNLQLFGANFGLENTRKLAALAGNPHERLRFIHVAGTNGKGSTCAILESIYRAAGLRVGLFTSPHLVAFGERIQVNRRLLPEVEIVRLVEAVIPWLNTFPASVHPTFFEVVTVMALRYFAGQEVDLVIWETGLGGRLDATNIVTPLASVITNVQFDHEKWLGQTLPAIAAEKGGIIKPNIPVVTAETNPEPLGVIAAAALLNGSSLNQVTSADTSAPCLDLLPLLGGHQRRNAALAVATVRAISDKIPVSDEAVRSGLAGVSWPGRLQLIHTGSAQTIILDGAHNPAGIEVLRVAIEAHFPDRQVALVFGVMQDKNWQAMCRTLSPIANKMLLAPVGSDRSASPRAIQEFCRQQGLASEIVACSSLAEAFDLTSADQLVLVTGSLHFVGEATEVLNLSGSPPLDERGLNEWTAGNRPAQDVLIP